MLPARAAAEPKNLRRSNRVPSRRRTRHRLQLPADQRRAPGEAAAHGVGAHEVPGRMRPSSTASASASGIEAAEVLAWRSTVTTTFSAGSCEPLADGVDDPPVGLVRHQPVEVGRREAALVEHGRAPRRPARRPRGGTPRGRSSADGRWCRSRTGRRRHRGRRSGGRRRPDGSPGCRGRCAVPGCCLGAQDHGARRRRRTARRCRGPASRAGARRSRRRSPARCAPGPARMKLSAVASA